MMGFFEKDANLENFMEFTRRLRSYEVDGVKLRGVSV